MSVHTTFNMFSPETIKTMTMDLEIEIVSPNSFNRYSKPEKVIAYDFDENDNLKIPYAYAISKLGLPKPKRGLFPQTDTEFTGELREDQLTVAQEAITSLNKNGYVMISSFTGFGKSIVGVYLSCQTKLKTLILIPNKTVLIDQWKESYNDFCKDCRVQLVKPRDNELDETASIYIMNSLNASKKSTDFFKNIGTLIVDECHLAVSNILSKALHKIHPRYLISLSATPYRTDGLDTLLKLFFGEETIYRQLNRKHTVYMVSTFITPDVDYDNNGKIIWNSVLNSQAMNNERNDMIVKLIRLFKQRIFLILCKRVEQARIIYKKLLDQNESVTILTGSEKTFNKDSRVLVGTVQKCAIGFNHPKLNALLVASDVEAYYIQYLGRVFRTQEGEPIILDVVDNHPILKKHWLTHKSVYIKHGGEVKDFRETFPNVL